MRDKTRMQEVMDNSITTLVDLMTDKSADKLDAMIPDNIIVFTGATGGTGTSTLIANIAYTLSKSNIRVCVVDMNISNPVQYIYLGYKKEEMKFDMIDFLSGSCQLGYAMNSGGAVDLLTCVNRNLTDSARIDNEEYSKRVQELLEKLRRLYNIVIIDCPMKIESRIINDIIYKANDKYIVLNESIGSYSALPMIDKGCRICGINTALFHCIVNKKTSINIPTQMIEMFGMSIDAVLPYISEIVQCGINGEIFVKSGVSNSKNVKPFCEGIDSLCEMILENAGLTKIIELEKEEVEEQKRGLFGRKKKVKEKKGKEEKAEEKQGEQVNQIETGNTDEEAGVTESENEVETEASLEEELNNTVGKG